uniref:Uncharacterized protein n=1 Tax=Streptomyces sp. NBC_00093 TaxID=2975649 RepID=A0AAU2A1S3_9ACTN
MTASSQTSSGALPPESPQASRPLPSPAGVFAAYGAVLPVPLGTAAATPQAAPGGAPDVQAEQEAGLVFSSESVQGIASTAYNLGVDDTKAASTELALLGDQDPKTLDWFHARVMAVAALCAGRPDDHLLTVREVLTAVDGRTATTAPLAITWSGTVRGLVGDTPHEDTVVPCTTVRGGPAALVLDDAERRKLGGLLLATLHTAEVCQTPGCGMTQEEVDACDPPVSDWILVRVAGASGPARWWCSVWCANSAITAGGAELAAADRAAAVDPDAQAPMYEVRIDGPEPHRFEPERLGESDAKRRVAGCRHCPGARTDAIHIWADDDQAATGGGL